MNHNHLKYKALRSSQPSTMPRLARIVQELRSIFYTHSDSGSEFDDPDRDASANLVKNETTSSDEPMV